MKQLTQELKSGKMEILEVPFPVLAKGYVLVKNHFSVISAGTESKTVIDARKGYLAKAKSRQKELKQVIDMIKTKGFSETYNIVMNKLEVPSSLGYSCAGEVIALGENVNEFKVGDLIACGGFTACHSEVVSVPENLCAKIPLGVKPKHAAFTTIAAIAVQGIRQAELNFGNNCLIIGLGLIGQLTAQILDAGGIKTIGIDVSNEQVERAKYSGIKYVFNRNQPGIEETIKQLSNGYGVDSVIITAGSSSLDPVELAGIVARRKAKVVIVGAVPTGFNRTNYYKKELDLRMSCSYGPGSYDLNYEEKGVDYPIEYVRWTEKRNMESFLYLLEQEKLKIDKLISHEFELSNAPEAYNMIINREENYSGIVIKYNTTENEIKNRIDFSNPIFKEEKAKIGFIGAGSFAQSFLLPNLKNCEFIGLVNGRGNSSVYVGKKYKFSYCTNKPEDIFNDDNINTIFIATRHNSHAGYIIQALESGKDVFVEKPLAMNAEDLNKIKSLYEEKKSLRLMVGFNRRFSPAIKELMKHFVEGQTKTINIRVNAGIMPAEHWVNDPEIGGGRIIGEGCHFIDLAAFIANSKIKSVFAQAMNDSNHLNNTVNINLSFKNGSIANIAYYSNGNKNFPKEYIDVYSNGIVASICDFKVLNVYSDKTHMRKFKRQDKGHKNEVELFINSIARGISSPISFDQIYNATLATLMVNESLLTGRKIDIIE